MRKHRLIQALQRLGGGSGLALGSALAVGAHGQSGGVTCPDNCLDGDTEHRIGFAIDFVDSGGGLLDTGDMVIDLGDNELFSANIIGWFIDNGSMPLSGNGSYATADIDLSAGWMDEVNAFDVGTLGCRDNGRFIETGSNSTSLRFRSALNNFSVPSPTLSVLRNLSPDLLSEGCPSPVAPYFVRTQSHNNAGIIVSAAISEPAAEVVWRTTAEVRGNNDEPGNPCGCTGNASVPTFLCDIGLEERTCDRWYSFSFFFMDNDASIFNNPTASRRLGVSTTALDKNAIRWYSLEETLPDCTTGCSPIPADEACVCEETLASDRIAQTVRLEENFSASGVVYAGAFRFSIPLSVVENVGCDVVANPGCKGLIEDEFDCSDLELIFPDGESGDFSTANYITPGSDEVYLDLNGDGTFDQFDYDLLRQACELCQGGPLSTITCSDADVDNDGDVDIDDLLRTLGAFGKTADGDTDGDGDTDIQDLLAVLGFFGETCP